MLPSVCAVTSPCTPDCLSAPSRPAGALRVARRAVALVPALLAALVGTPLLPAHRRDRWLQASCRRILRAAGIRLEVAGAPGFAPSGTGTLVVANHLSWIDVLALEAVQPVRMLAKHEVRDWPLIGGLARRSGALFVDRAGLRALPATVAATADALRSGAVVAVFPEGTTWCGAAAGRFRRAAFQAAVDAGAPVRPVAIVLRHEDGTPARGAAFVGDQSLLDSLRRVLRVEDLVCELTVLPGIAAVASPNGPFPDRRDLALHAGAAVAGCTGVPHGAAPVPRPAVRVQASRAAA